VLSLVICATSLLSSLLRRSKAEALLRVIGADSRFLRASQGFEFIAISSTGILIGLLVSGAGTWLLLSYYLELKPGYIGEGWIAMLYLILPVILLETIALLQRRRAPLQVLRE
jgi:predicted lysophospholipase L1 biosynthesis ABC-type transport system permease subunit